VERNFIEAQQQGLTGTDITRYIDDHVEMGNVLRTTMPDFDGGYVVCGLTGSGEMFSMRDPWGIRPAFYYHDDEVVALASERPVLQTTFNLNANDIKELQPGQALIVNSHGEMKLEQIIPQRGYSACSFERIYFSRGNDSEIYQERKKLGEQLTNSILRAIDNDVDHTVFSFIPNTAEVAYYGMLGGFKRYLNERKIERIESLGRVPTREELEAILNDYVRSEKAAWKDIKLRTFITEGNQRNDLASHVYDITYDVLEQKVDNLVVIDDSIVRGTTLKESIIKILDRLHPKKIVLVSSAPQIRYPDYYGIDMARLEEFIAFRACIELLKERGMHALIEDVYRQCKNGGTEAFAKQLYKPFTIEELNTKMVEMLRPDGVDTPIELVFQSIGGLHTACPNHPGDWYFTGDYPTPGGVRLCNQAFVNYIEKVYNQETKF
jgi:amidophosphoribosyltransferase